MTATVELATTAKDRVCHKLLLSAKAYCGRTPDVSVADWGKVTCRECVAARNADQAVAS